MADRSHILRPWSLQTRFSGGIFSKTHSCRVGLSRSGNLRILADIPSCIGGVGIFLIETGLEVARGLKEEGFEYNLATLKLFFDSPHSIILWVLPLALAILLRVITHFFHHQLIFPAYFFVIPIIFYIVVAIGGWDFDYLRAEGWVFDVGKNTQAWWKFYTYFVCLLFTDPVDKY
jgi:MFS superfamily sulfate permease-like transporter